MTAALFSEWFEETFIPEVKKYQKEVGKKRNVLLLIDNAPTHPSADLLERRNGRALPAGKCNEFVATDGST